MLDLIDSIDFGPIGATPALAQMRGCVACQGLDSEPLEAHAEEQTPMIRRAATFAKAGTSTRMTQFYHAGHPHGEFHGQGNAR